MDLGRQHDCVAHGHELVGDVGDNTKKTETASCCGELNFVSDLLVLAIAVNVFDGTNQVVECLLVMASTVANTTIRPSDSDSIALVSRMRIKMTIMTHTLRG